MDKDSDKELTREDARFFRVVGYTFVAVFACLTGCAIAETVSRVSLNNRIRRDLENGAFRPIGQTSVDGVAVISAPQENRPVLH